ncbi:MAG: flagellar brake protein [Planctomycetota bacterium]|jgi:c-di-GMP-binding flagellar brake protein YcgR
MNEVAVLRGAEPRKILQIAIERKVPAIMSYLSKGKWHVAKVHLTEIGACSLSVQLLPTQKPHPINIRPDQPVGISLKHGYGKFIFESKVVSLEPSPDAKSGGSIVLEVPDRIEIIQRRSYFRVEVPKSLKVNVMLWHRRQQNGAPKQEPQCVPADGSEPGSHGSYWHGRLVDISAGGAQLAIEADQEHDFKIGQFIGLRFTPMPYETPLLLSAQIRSILPTADGKNTCLGLQIVGLEASSEGRQILQRLCDIVERYYQMNESGAKQQDFRGTPNAN